MLFEENGQTIVSKKPLKKRFAAYPTKTRVIHKSDKNKKLLLNPNSKRYQVWEFLVVLVTIYTTLVTPFEVSFLPADIRIDSLFVMNLTIDLIFLSDTVLTFFLPYFDSKNGRWNYNRKLIAKRYLTGRFLLDFIPSIPYDLIAIISLLATRSQTAEVSAFKTLRVLRVLKVLKIVRLAKLSNIYRKYHDRIPLRYTTIALLKSAIMMLIFSHWLACILRAVVITEQWMNGDEPNDVNWLDNYFNGLGSEDETDGERAVFSEYVVAFYWAIMTLTTVGYGDVTPVTDFERSVVSVFMLIGAILYAYIVGSICGIIASLRKRDAEFFERLDELDEYMTKENLPHFLKLKVRNYFYYAESKRVYDQYKDLLSSLTPSLKEEVSTFRNHEFLINIPFISYSPINEVNYFITSLSVKLNLEVFPPFEVLQRYKTLINNFYIIKSGTLFLHDESKIVLNEMDEPLESTKYENMFYSKKFESKNKYTNGNCCCIEFLILDKPMVSKYFITTLTYCELYKLTKNDLREILQSSRFSQTRKNLQDFAKILEDEIDCCFPADEDLFDESKGDGGRYEEEGEVERDVEIMEENIYKLEGSEDEDEEKETVQHLFQSKEVKREMKKREAAKVKFKCDGSGTKKRSISGNESSYHEEQKESQVL